MPVYLENLYKPNPNNPVGQALSTRHNFRVIINRLNELIFIVEATTIGIEAESNNLALGNEALYSLTTGYSNVAIGYRALYSNTEGYGNLALGYQALYSNISGNLNVALGYQALYSNIEGIYNVAIGYQALYLNKEYDQNVAIGYRTLYHTVEGYRNTAIGEEAMYYNTDGYDNVAMGEGALSHNTIGGANTALGDYALFENTIGDHNTGVGAYAGRMNQTGDFNVFLGYTAGYSETGSNKLYITNPFTTLIYGEFDNDLVTIYGNLGIGTKTFGTNATRTLALINGTVPSSSPANTVQLYAEDDANSSELKVRDEGTTITVLSPHNFELFKPDKDELLPWSYHSSNDLVGKKINVDMSGAIRALEQLTGKQFIFYEDIGKLSLSKYLRDKENGLISDYIGTHITELKAKKKEAWGAVEVEVNDTDKVIGYKVRYELDRDTGEVKEIKRPKYGKKKVIMNRLKEGYTFSRETGEFLKTIKPTKDEASKAIKKRLKIPKWIKERI